MRYLLIGFAVIGLLSCTKSWDFDDVDFPNEIEVGESLLYLNGELVHYENRCFFDSVNNQLQVTFRFKPDFSVTNQLGFVFLPLDEGDYILHTDRELYKGAHSNFHQIVNSEFDGWDFELVRPEEGYFNIISVDSTAQTIQGKFKAYFEVTDKNGFKDTKLPERIKFEGMFYNYYEKG